MTIKIPIAVFKSLAIASTYGSAKNITALSNANPAVATSAAHGLTEGDIIEVTSGWPKLNGRVVRVGAVTTGTFELEGIDATDTDLYPAGEGIGSAKEITAWATVPNPKDISVSGGDPKKLEVDYLDVDDSINVITGKNPSTLTIPFKNDVTTAGYAAVDKADVSGAVTALRGIRKDGDVHLWNGTISLSSPNMAAKQDITNTMTVELVAKPMQYAAA